MSRTYKCTKGNSKKLKPELEIYLFKGTFATVRNEHVDYNNGTKKDLANLYRQGVRLKAPKKFKKEIQKSRKAKAKQDLKRKIASGDIDNVFPRNDVKNADYLYW
jgi:hypothetical protein